MIRVLIVEDHDFVRCALREVLDAEDGVEVVAEGVDGRTAAEIAARARPDVVVMDLSLPGVDGAEATRRVLARLPGVVVLGLTPRPHGTLAARALAAGARCVIPKGGAGPLLAAVRAVSGVRAA